MFQDLHPAPTILVIDDSIETVQVVEYSLQRAGFNIMVAFSGDEALNLMSKQGLPHLIIADLNMPPGMDGFELCSIISRWSDVPVIMLTAMDEVDMVVTGLQQYAEDYVVKPFTPDELIARIGRVLQRIGIFPYEPSSPLCLDGRLEIDFVKKAFFFDDKKISLTPTEVKLIYLLLRRPGDTISYEYLLRRMWPREMVFEDRLHVFVHRLRNKLDRHDIHHQYVALERGVGYRFAPLIEAEVEAELMV